MNRTASTLGLLICLVYSFGSCFAQTTYLNDVGSPAYSVQIPIENGFIDVSNGNLHMEFSLATHPQRGALKLNERLIYDSRIWTIGCYSNCYYWPSNIPNAPMTQAGWRFVTGAESGTISYNETSSSQSDCDYGEDSTGTQTITWTDPTGTSHTFNATIFWEDNTCDGNSSYTQSISGGYAADGSGYNVVDDGSGNPLVLDSQGTEVYPQVMDRYGNYWSFDSNGNLVDDTGRVPVIVTQNGNVTYYDVLSPNGPINNNGTRVRYTVTTAPIQVNTDFNSPYGTGVQDWSGTLSPVQSIQLPDGTSYTFTYDSVQRFQPNGYGELTSVTLPTGGVIGYDWATYRDVYNNTNRWLWKRTVGTDPPTVFTPGVITSCSAQGTGCKETVNVHKPSGDETTYELTINNGAWNTAINAYTGSAISGTLELQTTNTYDFSNPCPAGTCTGAAYITKSLETIFWPSAGVIAYTQPSYANPMTGQLTSVKEWDFMSQANAPAPGNPPSSTPSRETDYSYSGFDVQQVTVLGAGSQAGQTTYGYTPTPAVTTSGVTQHGVSTGPYLHTVSHWNNLNPGSTSTTTYAMDDTGEITSVIDPDQHPATSVSYQCANSLAYQVTNPLQQVTTYDYDCNSGATTGVRNSNDASTGRAGTTYQYDAVAGRLQSVSYPDGGGIGYSYPSPTETDTTVTASPDPSIVTTSIMDSIGRAYQTITNGVSSETTYDANGRVYCITNPHLSTASGTDGNTCVTAYDGLDRPLMQTQPDGSTVQWSYTANTTTTTDESGNSWQRTTNVFGQLTSVIEPGNLVTTYVYDGLGNLSNVTQNGASGETPRTRSFIYDSLSHLAWSSVPESGLTHDQYDSNGNLSTRTDARGIVTSYSYDPLNRLTSKQYSDGTPSACFQYDASSVNGIGQLSSEWTQAGTCPGSGGPPSSALTKRIITQYDPMGRETVEQQCPWGGCSNTNAPTLQYGFDLAGNRNSFTDVVNTTLSSSYDGAGRLSTLASSLWDGNHPQLVFAVDSYGPLGLSKSRLGNGYYESRSYTNRGWLQSYTASKASDTQTATPISGFVDIVRNHQDGGNAVPQNGLIDVIGWAYNTAGCPLAGVEIDLDSVSIGTAGMNGSRPDVQQALGGGSQYANCGWGFTGSVGDATPGTHTINVYGIDADGNRGLLNNQYTIVVSANSPPSGSEDGAVSDVDGSQNVLSGGLIYAYGWAIDSQMRAPVGAVKVLVDGAPIGFATLGGSRPDIASEMNDQRYLPSGWNFVGTVGNLSPGSHTISAEIYDSGGAEVAPQTPRQINVVADPNTIAGSFAINPPSGGSLYHVGDTLSIGGWAFESNYAPCATITRVEVWIDNTLQGTAQIGISRQDVADAFQNQNCLNSGWSYSGTVTAVDPGPHLVLIRAYDHSGGSIQLQQTPVITVSGTMLPSSVANPLQTQYSFALGYNPSGTVAYSSDSVNGAWAYLYDGLNRLSAAGSAYQTSLAWNYDSFGNLWSQVVTGGSGFSHEQSFHTGSNRSDQVCYDAAGNQLDDWGCDGSTEQYGYDAEERMSWAAWAGTMYVYDAEGRRVAKNTGGQMTYFLYDDEGHEVADMDGSGSLIRRQIYAGDRNIATYDDQQGTTVYAMSDWLGTQRARADMTSTLCQTTTTQPFGDGQQVNGTCTPSNNSFTGLERDQESGLDHTQFRQYSSTVGRWMSPDPYNGSMDVSNPQTLNRYAYVANNPLSATDPSGLFLCGVCGTAVDTGISLGGWVTGIGIALDVGELAYDLSGLFQKHPLTTRPDGTRPSYQPWDEHQFPIHYGPDIAGALGLPTTGGCEFGTCGFQQGGTTSSVASYADDFGQILLFAPGNRSTPLRLFGSRFCGPGGAGTPNSHVDGGCQVHDKCFDAHGINFWGNLVPGLWSSEQKRQAQNCNQTLYNTVRQYPNEPGSKPIQNWLKYGDWFGILGWNTNVH